MEPSGQEIELYYSKGRRRSSVVFPVIFPTEVVEPVTPKNFRDASSAGSPSGDVSSPASANSSMNQSEYIETKIAEIGRKESITFKYDELFLVGSDDRQIIDHLKESKVKVAIIKEHTIDQEAAAKLASSNLKELCFDECNISPDGFKELAETKAESLIFINRNLNFGDSLEKLLGNPNILDLEFVNSNINADFIENLRRGLPNSKVEFLSFRNTEINRTNIDAFIESLIAYGQVCQWQDRKFDLDLTRIDFLQFSAEQIERLKEIKSLRFLDLSESNISEDKLAKLMQIEGLSELKVCNCKLNFSSMAFQHSLANSKLETLEISQNSLKSGNLEFLAHLPRSLRDLTMIDMKSNALTKGDEAKQKVERYKHVRLGSRVLEDQRKAQLESNVLLEALEEISRNDKVDLNLDISHNRQLDLSGVKERLSNVVGVLKMYNGEIVPLDIPNETVNPLHGQHEAVQLVTGYCVTESPLKTRE